MRHLCSALVLLALSSAALAAPGFRVGTGSDGDEVQAVVFEVGDLRVAIVAAEQGRVDAATRGGISADVEGLMLVATGREGAAVPDLGGKIAAALEAALPSRKPAVLRSGRASLRGLVRNRIGDSEPLNERVVVLEARDEKGVCIALLVFLPLTSPPDGLKAALRSTVGRDCPVLLLGGAGADQRPTGSAAEYAARIREALKNAAPMESEDGLFVFEDVEPLPPSPFDDRREMPAQVLVIGDLALLAFPGRMTADEGLERLADVIRDLGSTDDFEALFVCRANGDFGLFPSERQWLSGRYDAREARFAPKGEPAASPPVEVEPLAGPTRKNRFSIQRVWMSSPHPSGFPANDRFPVEHYVPQGGARGAVIVLPIWRGGVLLAERIVATHLAKRGYEAAIMPLPWQFQRAPEGVKSGAWTVSSDLARTKAAMEQALADVRALTDWLCTRESVEDGRVGILGISLGAHVAASAYQLDDRFRAGVFVMAGGDPASMIWAASKETRGIKRDLLARGVTLEKLREMLKPLDPAAALPPQPFPGFPRYRGALMINGTQDTVVPPANARVLHEALGRPEIVWFDVDHYSMAEKIEEILALTDRHLDRTLR